MLVRHLRKGLENPADHLHSARFSFRFCTCCHVMLHRPATLWVRAQTQRCAGLVREKHSMDYAELVPNLFFIRPHGRFLLEKPAYGSLQQPAVIAAFDQRMTDRARSPIAYALPDYTGDCISHEVLGRISPDHIRL
jgi:hypothetical protein